MLPDNIRKEYLGKSYLTAIAGMAGIKIEFSTDDFGIDGYFTLVQEYKRKGKSRYLDTGCGIYFQLKSSSRWEIKSDDVVYDLEVKNYNDLISLNETSIFPCLLILFCMPKEESKWMQIQTDSITIKNACYWHYIVGRPSKNKISERTKIPISQRLTPESLKQILAPQFLRNIQKGIQ